MPAGSALRGPVSPTRWSGCPTATESSSQSGPRGTPVWLKVGHLCSGGTVPARRDRGKAAGRAAGQGQADAAPVESSAAGRALPRLLPATSGVSTLPALRRPLTLVPFPQEAEGPRAREPPRLRRRASRRRGRGRRVGRPSAGPPSPLGAWGSAPACADQEGRWGDTAPALPALRHPSASSPTPALLPHMVRGGPSRPLPPLRFVSREPRCLARPAHGRGAP